MHKPGSHLSPTGARLSHFINCPDVSAAQSVVLLLPAESQKKKDRRTWAVGLQAFVGAPHN